MKTTNETTARCLVLGSMFVLMLCVFFLSPEIYILGMMAFMLLAVTIGTAMATYAMLSEGGLLGFLVAGEIIKGAFTLIGVIVSELASAGE